MQFALINQDAGERLRSSGMDEPNTSALVLLQQEATELLTLFDQLRGDKPAPLSHVGQHQVLATATDDPTTCVSS